MQEDFVLSDFVNVCFDQAGADIYSMYFRDLFDVAETKEQVVLSSQQILQEFGVEKVYRFFEWLNDSLFKHFEFDTQANYVLLFDNMKRLYAIRKEQVSFYVPQQKCATLAIPKYLYYFIRSKFFSQKIFTLAARAKR